MATYELGYRLQAGSDSAGMNYGGHITIDDDVVLDNSKETGEYDYPSSDGSGFYYTYKLTKSCVIKIYAGDVEGATLYYDNFQNQINAQYGSAQTLNLTDVDINFAERNSGGPGSSQGDLVFIINYTLTNPDPVQIPGIVYKHQLVNIADSVRTLNGTTDLINIDEIPTKITETLQKKASGTLNIATNGEVDVTNYASVNVNVPLPTLNAPSISLSDNTLTITNPSTNGSFVSGYDVYKNGTLLTSITLATVDLSTLITEGGTYTITVKAKGTNFNESVASNSVEYAVSSVSFVQVHPQLDGKHTTLSNMDSSKIYGAHAAGYGYFKYENSSWKYYDIEGYGLSVYSSTTTSVTFYDTYYGDAYYIGVGPIVMIEGDTIPTTNDFAGLERDNVLANWACFVEGTLITMANGTYKKVEDINYGDEVLCYDFEKGEQTTSYIDWMIPKKEADFYWKITLSDNTILKLVGPKDGPSKNKSHRLYNVTKQSFVYPQDFEKDDYTLKENGESVKIISCEKIEGKVNFYNIASKEHINVYAEGVLTSNRLSNRFEIKDNKYTDKQLMTDEEIKAYKEHLERLKK